MVDLQTFRKTLTELGVKPGMHLIVHSAFSKFRGFEGGPEAFCRTLMETIGPEGLLLIPTFAFSIYEGKDYGKIFDAVETPSACGIVTNTFRKMPGVLRSLDPCHPVAAWGKDALRYVKNHHKVPTVDRESPIGLLEQDDGYVMTVGCPDSVTFMHVVEFSHNVPCLGCRTEEYKAKLFDGKEVKLRTWGWRKGRCTALDTPKIFDTMRKNGELKEAVLGEAQIALFKTSAYRKAYEPLLAAACPTCPIRPRVVSVTVPSDWDKEKHQLLPSDAFTGDTIHQKP